jgi:uncharacterized protein
LEFEWDEDKRQEVLRKHRIDIVYAARIFRGHVAQWPDERTDYGEPRMRSLGMVGDACFIVVHTERNNTIRLITAWKGGRRDREKYQKSLLGRDRKDA